MSFRKLLCVASTIVLTALTYTAATAKDAPSAKKCEEKCGKSGAGRATTKSWCEANNCKDILNAPKPQTPPAE